MTLTPLIRAHIAACLVLLAGVCLADDFRPPAGTAFAHTTGNVTVLPGGRALKPMGTQIQIGPGAFGLAISPKGLIGVSETGFERFGAAVLEPRKDSWQLHLFWAAPTDETDPMGRPVPKQPDRWETNSYGIAFDSEKSIWIAEGDSGKVRLIDASSGARRKLVSINAGDWHDSYTADLAIDPVRHILYVLDQANYRLVLIDTIKDVVLSSIPTGRMPFTIALSPDRNTAYVANRGMFRYQVLPNKSALNFPFAGSPGDPNDQESNSICIIDVHEAQKPAVTSWIHTGIPVGGTIQNGPDAPVGVASGGSAPDSILDVGDRVYVSNAHSDAITVISRPDNKVLGQIVLRVPWLLQLRGFLPAGMAYDPVKKWLFVAEAGINAVGVIDTTRNVVIGHLPVGLYPTRVGIADGRLWVVNARGNGAGANARRPLEDPNTPSTFFHGSISSFTMPAAEDLQKLTATTFAANGFFVEKSIPPALPAAIKHVVLIVKEDRAFDEILGDVGSASNSDVTGTAALARYGMHGRAEGRGLRFSIKEAAVTPNQHAIAKQFAFSDNFYADGDTDVDGHHWLTGVIPDLFTMSGVFASFGGARHFALDSSTPGRLLFAGIDAATLPEEIPENGTLWRHLERNGITFRNFGEGIELPGVAEGKLVDGSDGSYSTNVPIPENLYRNTSRDYPGFSLDVPDQIRADKFIAELDQRYKSGKEELPQFLYVTLPNDHTGDDRPDGGYPYAASWVADNDLALGRILDYLSHSPWWRETAVFVTEDTAAGGIDLIDAHRTVFLAAGPNIRRNYVSHTNTSFPGLLKTIFRVFRIPALNLMDQTAADLGDIFTDDPDYTPFRATAPDKRIFDPTDLGEKMKFTLLLCLALTASAAARDFDVVVYGGTAGGVIAAVAAAREGLKTALLEPTAHVGGMVSGGLGWTDYGKKEVIGGYAYEFYYRVGQHYGMNTFGNEVSWLHEPHVAEDIFRQMLNSAGVTLIEHARLVEKNGVTKQGTHIDAIRMDNGDIFTARIFIDSSYEGDLMAQSGVTWTYGRESSAQYGESLAGVRDKTPLHQFLVDVVARDLGGKLMPEISAATLPAPGSADKAVQSYNFRMCLSAAPDRIAFAKPEGYDPHRYELLARFIEARTKAEGKAPALGTLMKIDHLPNGTTDVNNNGAFSTDYIGGSWNYPNATYAQRDEIWQAHKNYQAGLFYFLANDPSVPTAIRQDMNSWGLCASEFTDSDHWPRQLYIREDRRMVGEYVMVQQDLQTNLTKPDPIGMGSYNSDSHNVERIVSDGFVRNEGDMQVAVKPYQIPYRVMLPKRTEAENLLVPVAFSASHVAYSSVRMEPQYMILGQAAGVAAKMAIDGKQSVQTIDSTALTARLRTQGAVMDYSPSAQAAALAAARSKK